MRGRRTSTKARSPPSRHLPQRGRASPCNTPRNSAPLDAAAATPIPARSDPQALRDNCALELQAPSHKARVPYIEWRRAARDTGRPLDAANSAFRSPLSENHSTDRSPTPLVQGGPPAPSHLTLAPQPQAAHDCGHLREVHWLPLKGTGAPHANHPAAPASRQSVLPHALEIRAVDTQLHTRPALRACAPIAPRRCQGSSRSQRLPCRAPAPPTTTSTPPHCVAATQPIVPQRPAAYSSADISPAPPDTFPSPATICRLLPGRCPISTSHRCCADQLQELRMSVEVQP